MKINSTEVQIIICRPCLKFIVFKFSSQMKKHLIITLFEWNVIKLTLLAVSHILLAHTFSHFLNGYKQIKALSEHLRRSFSHPNIQAI